MELRTKRSYAPPVPKEVLPKRWKTGPPTQRDLAIHCSEQRIPSVIGVEVDSILIDSIYGQHTLKAPHRQHDIKSLAPTRPNLGALVRQRIYEEFEDFKDKINFSISAEDYIERAGHCSDRLLRLDIFSSKTDDMRKVISWCLISYSMLLNKDSLVRLRTVRPSERLEFGVYSNKELEKGLYLYELMGVMAADTEAEHSRLSEIHPHPSHNKGNDIRIWFGPSRFVNHDCQNWNVEIIAISNTAAYAMRTTKAIKKNEEIFLNYGFDYFDDVPTGCPCSSCRSNRGELAVSSSSMKVADPPSKEGEISPLIISSKRAAGPLAKEDAKRLKKEKNRQNRKLGRKNFGGEASQRGDGAK